jgi:enterochelin esterase-like enzyme
MPVMVRVSRRAVLIGGLSASGAVALAAGGGYWLVQDGVVPGKYRLAEVLGRCGPDPGVPDAVPGPVRSQTFTSRYRRRTVTMITMLPPGGPAGSGGRPGLMPVAIVLHGAGGDAASAVALGYPHFLAQAVTRGGVAPFALVSVDGGGSSYWHPRADGDNPLAMIIHEVLPRLARRGFATARIGITGWSMGGYGALLLAERLGPRKVAAVAVSSAAIFGSYGAAQTANPGAFDSAANFAANDLQNGLATLRRLPVLIDCGRDDPFAAQDLRLRGQLGQPAGTIGADCHDAAFWRRSVPAQLAFLGPHLSPSGP